METALTEKLVYAVPILDKAPAKVVPKTNPNKVELGGLEAFMDQATIDKYNLNHILYK